MIKEEKSACSDLAAAVVFHRSKSVVGSAFCLLLTWLQSQRAALKESLSLQQERTGHHSPVGSLPDRDHLLCFKQPLSPRSPDSDKTCTGTGGNVRLLLFLMGSFGTCKPFCILWDRSGTKQPSSVIWYHVEPDRSRTSNLEICAKPSPSWAANGRRPNDISTHPCVILLCALCQAQLSQTSNNEKVDCFVLLWRHCSDCIILQAPRAEGPHYWTHHIKPGAQQLQKLHCILTINLSVDLIPKVTSSVLHNNVAS